jgi:iron complex outermembrane receptor protein
MKKLCPVGKELLLSGILCIGYAVSAFSQEADSSLRLKEVTIRSYFRARPVLRLPSSVSVVDSATLHAQGDQSLVSPLNTTAGVRMEERSPGSYRLSIRGSLLRSSFGIRNVKIYLDDFPLTDAGGNTYLNLLDPGLVERMEILKGPDGSIFGANSGGVVRINLADEQNDSNKVNISLAGGSYGMYHEYASVQHKIKNNVLSVGEGLMHSDGYRENSSMDRKYVQLLSRWKYFENSQLRFLFLYSDLTYRTPGGLTLEQLHASPTAARPPSGALPGAAEQKAGVHNATLYTGFLNELGLAKNLKFVTAFFGSHTDFQNPFITNYEVREEESSGMRTWLDGGISNDRLKWSWNAGAEIQRTSSRIANYGNRSGEKDTMQAKNNFDVMNEFIFLCTSLDLNNKLQGEASLSYNFNEYWYQHTFPGLGNDNRRFNPQLMPRVAASWLMNSITAWRAVISKGYSPPTLAEILPSGNIFNKDLQPESGINYETGIRMHRKDSRFWWDVSAFYYRLKDAIVRKADEVGNEFFANAGRTDQRGIETQLLFDVIRKNNFRFIRQLQLSNAGTFYMFRFRDYKMESADYSGNRITGVPDRTLVSGLSIGFPRKISVLVQHNYTSSIPLNDANSEFAKAYHLLQAKVEWKYSYRRNTFCFYAGADNILNTSYSLGNDLNAAGKRYYNPAPARNYFAGLSFTPASSRYSKDSAEILRTYYNDMLQGLKFRNHRREPS